jgi:hypothetical protein
MARVLRSEKVSSPVAMPQLRAPGELRSTHGTALGDAD